MKLNHLPISDGVCRRLQASLTPLSHAYIISGPSQQVNRALADQMAAAYVCSSQGERPCGVCSNCKKAQSGIHPDIITLQALEDKQSISVEQTRQLRADAYIRPNEAARKVYLIDATQFGTKDEAQNSLLKVLEDGPDYLAFIFLAEQPKQLLQTIRSRCEMLSLTAGDGEKVPVPEEVAQAAQQMAHLLMDGSELERMEFTVELERKKWNRETMKLFLAEVEETLRPELAERGQTAAPLLEHIQKIRLAVPLNVGVGNLLGWLCAGAETKK